MKTRQKQRYHSHWRSRLLNAALLFALVLGPLALPGAAGAQSPTWEFQGPAPQTNAQQDLANVAEADEPVSGAVTAIAASPTDPDLVYIGAANGGVWKTTNATAADPTWVPLTDQLQSLSIGLDAVALDPLDGTGQTVIAGTGRFSGYANRGDDHVGIYYTTDGGTTWTVSTSPLLSAARITGVAARGSTMLVASENGLFRTTGGVLGAWTKISGTGGLPDARAADIAADPNDNNRFFVTFVGASGGLYRSDDLGATWTNVTGAISGITASTDAFEVAVFDDGTDSAVSVVLNGVGDDPEANAIFYSANGGAFTALDLPDVFKNAYGKFGLAADKTDRDLIYVSGGYALIGSNPFLATTYRIDASQASGSQLTHLYSGVSADLLNDPLPAAQTWMWVRKESLFPTTTPFDVTVDSEQMTVTSVTKYSWYYTFNVVRGANGTTPASHAYNAQVYSPAAYGAPHVDINNLALDANGGLWMGAHGGIFFLPQPGSATSAANTWFSGNGNLGVSEMHDVAYDHVSDILIGSNQDNCVVIQSAPGNHTWPVGPNFGGDGGDVAVADIGGGQSARYASNQNLSSFRRLVYDAANNLISNTSLSTSVVTDKQFTTPIAVNAVDPDRLLIGGSDNLYESLNMGDTINKIATVGVYDRAIAYGGRRNGVANPDVLYVADGASTFYVRTTAGGEVVAKPFPSGTANSVRDIVMNSEDWMNVFVIDYFNRVFVSTDAGDSWTNITGNLLSVSSTEFWTIEFVEGPSPYVAVGTRSGVFASRVSALGSWFELGTDLPDVLTFDLDYDAVDDVLAAGTLGRGAWLLADASGAFVLPAVAPVLALSGPTAADEGATATYDFTVDDPGDSFIVDTLDISAGGTLVPNSLNTTAAGGSFQVSFDDGPTTVTIDLGVTDSTGEFSNLESTSVTVANVNPVPTILGAPTSGSPGTPVNLQASATDASPTDTAAGFSWYWWVIKDGHSYDQGNTNLNFSFTPDTAGTYQIWLKATDKDSGYRWSLKTMTAASPDLTIDEVSVTVAEGQTALNSGTFQNVNGNPLTLSASVGTLTRETWTPVTDLVSYWHADGNTNDSVDGNNGVLVNGAGYAAGKAGQAFSFNGANQYVSVPSSANIEMRNNLTVMAWFNVNSLASGGNAKVFSKRSGTFGPYEINIYNDGTTITAKPQVSVSGSSWVSVPFAQTINTGTWYHAAIVIDSSNLLSFYVDGQLVDSLQLAGPVMAHAGAAFLIGTSASGFPLNGLVDEVQIVNRALTADEVEAVYEHSPAVFGTWSWSYSTGDGPAESQTVTIAATDDVNSEVTEISFPLTVENVGPAATFANGGAVDEGSAGAVSFSDQFDPSTADAAALHYAYDFDNDGSFDSGDGTYAGSGASASETVPASYLADGPATRTVRGRILDKDGGYTDYTTDITVNNAAPTASVSGPATALVGQLVPFVVGATDPSADDQAAGFSYSINWGDGSPLDTIPLAEGNSSAIARHAYASTGNYNIQVTATDRDAGTSAPGSTSVQVNTLDAASLQALIATEPYVEFAPADDAAFQNEVAAINGLSDPGSEVAITLILGVGPYTGVTLSPPANIILDLAGNDTRDWTGTQITGSSPAVTVTSGEVFVQGNVLSTATDSPTVLVTGGHLTLDQVEIQESSGFDNVAVRVTGGSVNLGFDVLMNVNGDGGFVDSYVRSALVPHPEGIDAELTPNTFQVDGETINAVSLSSTGLVSSLNPSEEGEDVTFTAVVDVKAIEHGPATGTVDFYDGATLLGSGTVSKVGDEYLATFPTSSLSQGTHTIRAVYSGDDAYVASAAELTQQVDEPTAVTLVGFEGRVMDDGSVLLEWQTASEVDLLGFYLYRAASETDTPVRLNEDLIPGQSPGSPTGGDYAYQDPTTVPGATYYYWLEDVDAHGAATRYGPVSVIVEPDGGFTIYLPLVSKN